MANEITWADLTAAGTAASHLLAAEVEGLLGDPTDLRAAIPEIPFDAHMGSAATRVGQMSVHGAFSDASSEESGGGSNADPGDTGYTHTLARRYKRYQISDLARLVAPAGGVNVDKLAMVLANGVGETYTSILGDLFPSIANNVGSTAADMSVDYVFDAMYQLALQHVPGPWYLVLRPKAHNELVESVRGETGALQYLPTAGNMLMPKGPAYKGEFLQFEVYATDYVDADGGGTYYQSAAFGRGAFTRQAGPASERIPPLPAEMYMPPMGELLITFSYDGDNALTLMIGDMYCSVKEAEDLRAVEIRSQVA